MKLNTVIFDMDGLLIDSEPLWKEAANTVFKKFDITLSHEQYASTTGLRTTEFVQRWLQYFNISLTHEEETSAAIVEEVMKLVKQKGKPMPGVDYIFEFFKAQGFNIGLATSSGLNLVDIVVSQLGIGHYLQAITSAEFIAHGKPHPQVYLDCASALTVSPAQCVCFEDSFNGMIAAKAAGMKCVVVPSAEENQAVKWHAADLKISSLMNFNNLLLLGIQY